MKYRNILTTLLSVVAIYMCFSTTASAQLSGRARFVYCNPADTANYSTCVENNRLRNDKDTQYVDKTDGVTVAFYAGASNDLTVNMLTTTKRQLTVDLTQLTVESSGQTIPSWTRTAQTTRAFVNVRKAYLAKTFCGVGVAYCEMNTTMGVQVSIAGDGSTYHLQMVPNSVKMVNLPETTSEVKVAYSNLSGKETWTVTPLMNANTSRYIAGMEKAGKSSSTRAGQYILPFTFTAELK